MKKKELCTILFCAVFFTLFSQTSPSSTVGFFSAVSDSKETNTITLIQDLYFSHVSILDRYTVFDYRTVPYSAALPQNIEKPAIAFYVAIHESDGTWICILNAVTLADSNEVVKELRYDSYYQILLDAKIVVSDFFASLSPASVAATPSLSDASPEKKEINVSLDLFSGTWAGDEFIDKVVILRAGRGFIIYKNGATMNISVRVENNKIIARQTSKANASFFPELPRELALTAAPLTDPLEWVMEAVHENKLTGIKKTIEAVYENGNPVSVQKITAQATWTR